MGKVLAIAFLLVFAWWAAPILGRGEWIAPTAIAPDTWMSDYAASQGQGYLATPPQGYGWFRFDFWNNPPQGGRPVVRDDFRL